MSKFKTFIRRILPASKNQVDVRFSKLETKLSELNKNEAKNVKYLADIKKLCVNLDKELAFIRSDLDKLQESCEAQTDRMIAQHKKILAHEKKILANEQDMLANERDMLANGQAILANGQDITGQMQQAAGNISERVEVVRREVIQTKRAGKEAVWGEVFRDSIVGSQWLKTKCFSPGRWAVGYQYLYVLYRILNSVRPRTILELGLGQSTSMITQYADYEEGVTHRVVEHDSEWIDYYRQEFEVSAKTEIINLNISKMLFKNQYELYHYEQFRENLDDLKYDFISIDAPFGHVDNEFSRIDVLDLIPDCLASSFVIMVDDVNRKGEQNMIRLLKEILDKNGIEYSSGMYVGDKDTYTIASMDKKFVCTL